MKALKIILKAIFFLIIMSSAAFADVQPAIFSPAQVTAMQKIMRDYLIAHPEVLVQASNVLQARQQQKAQSTAIESISQNKTALFDDAKSPSIGNKAAPVTIVEFFDYQCGHCRDMAPRVEKLISQDKNIHIIFKEFPIFGALSELAAKMALAANMQSSEKYYAFHNVLLTSTVPLNQGNMIAMAKKVGLNIAELNTDMSLPSIAKQLQNNLKLAEILKLPGTPAFIIANHAQTKFEYIPSEMSFANLQMEVQKARQ
ncbi:MAG TPA: DsbA family protein [Coxiellaceae bacterium]|nr:MAG: hypothetical protein A3E81_04310 [Gammaproteobacteria bacterium RIFCSPHIGHO2_12_FULL_36_30]HLB56020.1 DsbA family protein [Coxiellaceae bacterium]